MRRARSPAVGRFKKLQRQLIQLNATAASNAASASSQLNRRRTHQRAIRRYPSW